jgi:hypothetical protein
MCEATPKDEGIRPGGTADFLKHQMTIQELPRPVAIEKDVGANATYSLWLGSKWRRT